MTGKMTLAVLLATLWLTGAGCATKLPELKATRTIPVELDTAKKFTAVTAQFATELKLELPPVKVAGFRWQVFAQDTRFLKQTSEVTPTPGVPGGSSVSFLVINLAQRPTKIRFLLIEEANAKGNSPVDVHDVIVTID